MRIAIPTRRRLVTIGVGLLAAAGLASSCSFDAAVATDASGRVTSLDALQIRSGALGLAVALALEGSQLVLELRWRPEPSETTLRF